MFGQRSLVLKWHLPAGELGEARTEALVCGM